MKHRRKNNFKIQCFINQSNLLISLIIFFDTHLVTGIFLENIEFRIITLHVYLKLSMLVISF